MELFPLGAGREVGRSCLIVKVNECRIMLDCGVHMGHEDEDKFPEFQKLLKIFKKKTDNKKEQTTNTSSDEPNMYKYVEKSNEDYSNIVDLLIISHFHLDHCGALPFFTELLGYKGPILCSQPTKAILPVTLEDFRKVMSDYKGVASILKTEQIKNCVKKIETIEINETRIFNKDIKVTCFYAGHVLGACMFLIDINGYKITYTGDCNTIIDRHLSGAYMPKIFPDILMIETTYGNIIRETKRIRERKFLKKIHETLLNGGKILIPIFALGRAQELCVLIENYWKRTNIKYPIYFVGPMGQKVNFYYKLFQNWMNNAVKSVFTKNNVFDFKFVQQTDKSLYENDNPMVIFATPGMLHGGFSLKIFKRIAPIEKNCVIIVGFCSEGTVGNRILSGEKEIIIDNEKINVKCEVYYMSFSAHADQKGILQLVKNIEPKNLVLVHGDYSTMTKFKETCQSQISAEILMPKNKEISNFNNLAKYEQVSMSKNLIKVIETLEKIKTRNKSKDKDKKQVYSKSKQENKTNSNNYQTLNVKNVKYNKKENALYLKKINLFGSKKRIMNNKINIIIKNENIVEIFNKVIKIKEQEVYNDFQLLQKEKILKYIIDKVEDQKTKICFEYQYDPNTLDGNIINKKCLNIIKIFQLINKEI